MSPEPPPSRRERLLGGGIAVAIGLVGLVLMYRHPESFRVPAWVGFAAMSTFVWGGSAILLRENAATTTLADGAVLLTLIGLIVPAAWIAFGFGALIAALLFVRAARQALTKR